MEKCNHTDPPRRSMRQNLPKKKPFAKLSEDCTELFLLWKQWRQAKEHLPKSAEKYALQKTVLPVCCFALLSAVLLGVAVFHTANTPAPHADESIDVAAHGKETHAGEDIAAQTITVSLIDGAAEPVMLTTAQDTVERILAENALTLGEYDELNHALGEALSDGDSIAITRISIAEETTLLELPYETVTNRVQTIPRGTTRVVQSGQIGKKSITERITLRNGEESEREVISESVQADPVDEIVNYGIGGSLVGKDGVRYAFSYYVDVSATAYGPTGNNTATGVPPTEGTIAVDPSVIPLRSKVYVKGNYGDYGICRAEDTGGGIKGNKIDVYLGYLGENWYSEAMQFGIRSMRVYILG